MLDLLNYVWFVMGERNQNFLSWVQDEIPFDQKSALVGSSGTTSQVQFSGFTNFLNSKQNAEDTKSFCDNNKKKKVVSINP